MIFGKKYFEEVFKKEDPWQYFSCEYEKGKYVRQIETVKQYSPHPQSILEIGCAEGAHTMMLARAFPEASIVGIDISKFAVKRAKQNCEYCRNVNVIEADIIELFKQAYFPESTFDVIIQSELLYYLFPKLFTQLNLIHYLSTITKILKNNGIFVTSNQLNIRTRSAMGTCYLILKHLGRLAQNSEYKEWHDIRCKYLTYDLKIFTKAK
ncbi:MAG: class I SAM-dependent methyltransferase [Dehalococcoidia bacterium]